MATNFPTSNKKIFAISTLVANVAVLGFTILVTQTNFNSGVDKAVMQDELDPTKVFDAPIVKANLYYIDLEKFADDLENPAKIGCGDGLVSYPISLGELNGVTKADATTHILDQLFNNSIFEQLKTENADDDVKPYNVLATSTLKIKSINETPTNYEVRLTGSPVIAGACDVPRVQAQLEQTIRQIYAPSTVTIYLNDKTLAEALSSK